MRPKFSQIAVRTPPVGGYFLNFSEQNDKLCSVAMSIDDAIGSVVDLSKQAGIACVWRGWRGEKNSVHRAPTEPA